MKKIKPTPVLEKQTLNNLKELESLSHSKFEPSKNLKQILSEDKKLLKRLSK